MSVYYFAYASNLLLQRLMVSGYKTLKFERVARLADHRLAFKHHSKVWNGSPATIEPSEGDSVWGAVWAIDALELPLLDKQEGVGDGIYEQMEVTVVDESCRPLKCISYRLLKDKHLNGKPSFHYLDVIIRGALQCGLPSEYIESLKKIEHNGCNESLPIVDKINAISI